MSRKRESGRRTGQGERLPRPPFSRLNLNQCLCSTCCCRKTEFQLSSFPVNYRSHQKVWHSRAQHLESHHRFLQQVQAARSSWSNLAMGGVLGTPTTPGCVAGKPNFRILIVKPEVEHRFGRMQEHLIKRIVTLKQWNDLIFKSWTPP